MNLKFLLNSFRRRTLTFVLVLGVVAAMLPTAAFASGGYGHQGRAWDPGPAPHQSINHPSYNNNNHGTRNRNNPNYNNQNNRNHNNNNPNYGNNNNYNKYHSQDSNGRCDQTYTVRRGDTLSRIAARFHISVDRLARANNLRNPNRIFVGQVLCIPCY